MNNDRELLQQALDALESCDEQHPSDGGRQWFDKTLIDPAIEAIRAQLSKCDRCGEVNPAEIHTCSPKEPAHSIAWWNHEVNKAFVNGYDKGRASKAQPEHEPYCYVYKEHGEDYFARPDGYYPADAKPLYTAPPQREWQGLTDEEIRNEANHHVFDESFFNGAVWARGKIKEKNNG